MIKDDKIKYSLRIAKISIFEKNEIALKYPDLKFRFSNRAYTDKNLFALIFDLEVNRLDLIKEFIREFKIQEDNYDLFISFTTYKDITGISMPKSISDFLRDIGGKIEISIINLMNTEED